MRFGMTFGFPARMAGAFSGKARFFSTLFHSENLDLKRPPIPLLIRNKKPVIF